MILTDSSSIISVVISILAFLVSARLFGFIDSCLFGLSVLADSGALVLSFGVAGEGVGAGRAFGVGA